MIPLKIETLLDGRVVEHEYVSDDTEWLPMDITFIEKIRSTMGGI